MDGLSQQSSNNDGDKIQDDNRDGNTPEVISDKGPISTTPDSPPQLLFSCEGNNNTNSSHAFSSPTTIIPKSNGSILSNISSLVNNNSDMSSSISSKNHYTTEIVRSLFGSSVGPVHSDYPCSRSRHSGRLYIGTHAACFYSNIFGIERRSVLPYNQVSTVEKHRTSGIVLVMSSGEEHLFRGFNDRDEVYGVLIGGGLVKVMESSDTLIRLNRSKDCTGDTANAVVEEQSRRSKRKKQTTRDISPRSNGSRAPSPSLNSSRDSSTANNSVAGSVCSDVVVADEEENDSTDDDNAIQEAFLEVKKSSTSQFKETALLDYKLPPKCNLQTFYEKFLSDDAIHSISSYKQDVIGDKDIVTGEWQSNDENDNDCCTEQKDRKVTFLTKVTSPIGPPYATCTTHQTMRTYGNYGIVIDTKTTIENIQYSDCFYMMDRWIIEHNRQEGCSGGGGVSLTVYFKLNFVKSTIMKGIISKMSKSETISWFNGYVEFLNNAFNDDNDDVDGNEAKQPLMTPRASTTEKKIIPSSSSFTNNNDVTVPDSPKQRQYPNYMVLICVGGMFLIMLCFVVQSILILKTINKLQMSLMEEKMEHKEELKALRQVLEVFGKEMLEMKKKC